MSVKVVFELNLQEGKTSDLVEMMRGALPFTRKYDGCERVNICVGQEDQTQVILVSEWASKEKYLAYVQYRTDDGSIAKIGSMLASEPRLSIYDIQDA
ncbi:antibiotic biosynthesis monooxygenase [Alphaproteobacteria bacterium]|jgi:quinol monooxygenase YgiN|nr:antibiotic biosynthesis monooxygenase [Alphaproteobacteria bacterium]